MAEYKKGVGKLRISKSDEGKVAPSRSRTRDTEVGYGETPITMPATDPYAMPATDPYAMSATDPYAIPATDSISTVVDKKFYNTISCPCSTYTIKDSNGKIGCEREYYGVKQYFNTVIRTNHFLENRIPTVGGKWACEDKTCIQSGFIFDGYYIVEVNENKNASASSSIVNSRMFTDNCFIPQAQYFSDYTQTIEPELQTLLDESLVTTINGVPIYKTLGLIEYYGDKNINNYKTAVYYDFNGIKGWAPPEVRISNKIITSLYIGNRNYKNRIISGDMGSEITGSSRKGLINVDYNGGIIPIRINGFNSPSFTITIKDSSGCSILEKQIKNFSMPESGEYLLYQRFPIITPGKTSETYDITITPTADTSFYLMKKYKKNVVVKEKVYQFKKPTLSITHNASTITNSSTTTSFTTTVSGKAFSKSEDTITHALTVARSSGSDFYYSKGLALNDCITRSDVIKKTIKRPIGEKPSYIDEFIIQDAATALGTETGGFTRPNSGDVEVGMEFTSKIEYTKTIFKIIELDQISDDDCIDCDEDRPIKTNKFGVDETGDLFEGMIVTNNNFESYIVSIDCTQNITIAHEHIVHKGDTLTFSHVENASVMSVDGVQGDGVKITINNPVKLPNEAELVFNKPNAAELEGYISIDVSGDLSITATATITKLLIGQEDVTFTLDPDLFITNKPPIRDLYVEVSRDSETEIKIADPYAYNTGSLETRISNDSTNGATAALVIAKWGLTIVGSKLYTPNPGFVGHDKIKYTIHDGTTNSDEKLVFITVK